VPEDLTANQVSDILDAATDPFARTSDLPAADGTFGIPMRFQSATGANPGVAGDFNFNSATPASITVGRFKVEAPTGVTNQPLWALCNPRRGEFQVTHEDGTMLLTINGDGALNGTFYEAPVDYVSGPLPANNAPCRVVYLPGEQALLSGTVNGTPVALAGGDHGPELPMGPDGWRST
jgi:hypothetical protein